MIGAWDKDTNVYFVITLEDKCRPPACSSQLSGHSLSYMELPPADANARHIPPFVSSVALLEWHWTVIPREQKKIGHS